MSNTQKMPWPAGGSWPHQCKCCSDSGIEGEELPPHPFARRHNYCGCPAGVKLRQTDADAMVRGLAGLVEQANEKRERILGLQ